MRPFVDDLLAQSTRLLGATAPEEVLTLTCREVQRRTGVERVFGSVGARATWQAGLHQAFRSSERADVNPPQRSALFAVHRALSRQRGPVRLARATDQTIVHALCGADAHGCEVMAFPIVQPRHRVAGCLALCATGPLTEALTAYVSELARLAALALDNVLRIASARRDRERLRLLAEAAEDALWDWSPDTGEFWWGGGVHALLGDVVVQSRLAWKFDQVHPDDMYRVLQSFEQALAAVDRETWREEYRQRRADGSFIRVEDHAHILRDSSGRAYRVVGSLRDVTELRALFAREQDARADAERANLAKDDFLAMLGHELRNPLSPILTALHLLRRGGGPDAIEKPLAIIERQAHHLTRLVDDLLDVARIAQGKVLLAREHFDLAEAIDAALEIANPLIEERGHAIETRISRGLMVHADRARMEQVIGNLITNAAKYTPHGGRIVVEGRPVDGLVEVRVSDSGIGISPDMLARIFDSFVQVEQTLDRTRGGLGLGLAIVRNLVLLHGGTVSVASEGDGRGAEFVIRLPPASAVPVPEPDPAPVTVVASGPRRILVVDDNHDAADALARGLTQMGHHTRVVHDGSAVLPAVGDFDPDVVLLDLGLPTIDGYEVARRLRRRYGPERPRLVAVTGYGQESDRRKTQDAGFDAHLVKPVLFEKLYAAVVDAVVPPRASGPDEGNYAGT